MKVIFDLGAFSHCKAQPLEYGNDFIADNTDGMAAAQRQVIAGKGEVDFTAGRLLSIIPRLFQGFIFRLGKKFEFIQQLAGSFFIFRGHIFHLSHNGFYQSLAAKIFYPESLCITPVESRNFLLDIF